jgi:RAB6A-GEF complex partner protein 1
MIQTSESHLVLITVRHKEHETSYEVPLLPPNAQRNFLAGPGEGLPLQAIGLVFEGVVRVEGTLLRYV